MAIETQLYRNGPAVLLDESWTKSQYAAVLVSGGYTPDPDHTTYSEISTFIVGAPLGITNRTISRNLLTTTLSCDDFNFSSQGTLSARYLIILAWGGSLQSWNRLVAHLDLNVGDSGELAITPAIQIDGQSGLIELGLDNG